MQKWRLIAIIVVMAAILVAGGLALLRFEPPRATRANYRRIHQGMTRAEVVEILGPPTSSSTGRNDSWVWLEECWWGGESCSIWLEFRLSDGRVHGEPLFSEDPLRRMHGPQ